MDRCSMVLACANWRNPGKDALTAVVVSLAVSLFLNVQGPGTGRNKRGAWVMDKGRGLCLYQVCLNSFIKDNIVNILLSALQNHIFMLNVL